MSGDTGNVGGETLVRRRRYAAVTTVGFALLTCVLAISLSVPVGAAAQENDTEAPAFGNATKGNLTTIELTITDDVDVAESSIAVADFALSSGTVADVAVNETGNGSQVEIRLSDVVAENNVTVSIADGRSITDAAGNRLTNASAVVTGMDGYRPQLQRFEVRRINGTAATVTVVSSEPLSQLYVGIGGPGTDTLTLANFTKFDTPARFEVPYEATVTFPSDGRYDFVVGTLVDENGVESRYVVEKTLLVDETPPTAAITAPASTPGGAAVTFSGQGSTDEFGVTSYNWSIDGTPVSTNETVEHVFHAPGYHEVTLTVTDRRGNADETTYPILVESEVTTEAVAVDVANDSAATVTVGPNRTTRRVRIATDGSLVSTDAVRLESLTVDVPMNESAELAVASRSNVSAWFAGTNATGLSGVAAEHDRSLAAATFRFAVNRSRLDAAGVAPENVTLYREVEGWRPVYTTEVARGDGWITYEATAAGLSRFVVGGSGGGTASSDGASGAGNATADDATTGNATSGDATAGASAGDASGGGESTQPGGSPSIHVANSTLLTPSVDSGDRAIVRAVARNGGNATGTSVVGLVVNNTVVETTNVTVPPGENRTVTFAERLSVGGTVVVNGTLAGTLSVGGENASAAPSTGGGLPIPNPLALWPGGLFGRVLGAVFWFLVVLYAVLKALAIYLGY